MSTKRALAKVASRKHTPAVDGTCVCDWGDEARTGTTCAAGTPCLPCVPYGVANRYAAVLSEGQEHLHPTIRASIRNWEPTLHRPDLTDPAPF